VRRLEIIGVATVIAVAISGAPGPARSKSPTAGLASYYANSLDGGLTASGAVRDDGVIIDVSSAAAEALGFVDAGRARVRLEVIGGGPDRRRASGWFDESPEHRLDRLTLA
jgi:rare lipoprotein A (peptidoglycan hydrolase)